MIVCTDPASARISTLSLHDALPISVPLREFARAAAAGTDIRPDGGAPRMHGDPAGGRAGAALHPPQLPTPRDRKSTRLNSSHTVISYAVFCLKKNKMHFLTSQMCTQ